MAKKRPRNTAKIAYGGKLVIIDLDKELDVSIENLDKQRSDQAKRFAFFAEQLESSIRISKIKKLQLETLEGELYLEIVEQLEAESVKAYDSRVKAEMKRMPAWKRARKALISAERIQGSINRLVQAFNQRRDMLVSLALSQHSERKHLGMTTLSQLDTTED